MIRIYLKLVIFYVLVSLVIISEYILYRISRNKYSASLDYYDVPSFYANVNNRYLVQSSNCKIPNLNPFDKSVINFIKKINRTECSAIPPLTKVTYHRELGQHILTIDYNALKYYNTTSDFMCCARAFSAVGKQTYINPCVRFKGGFIINKSHSFILVFCENDRRKVIYENMHASNVKRRKSTGNRLKNKKRLNVLLIGFDSMSRLNLYRAMPKTATYLYTHGWAEMRGYNKIADNTLPNFMAFLTGKVPQSLQRAQNIYFDSEPFIWKEFSAADYVTAYAEDQPLVSTFTCHLKGFKSQPTDHYFRNYLYVGELLFMGKGRPEGCVAFKTSTEHIFDYLLDFVNVYKDDKYFGLFWGNQISHNNMNRASAEDERVVEMLERLRESGAMNSSMIIFLSDHGLRVGDARKTNIGWYEDRLPFLFISLPEWFKNDYSTQYLNLLENGDRLTSPFDLYLTLKSVLYDDVYLFAPGCPTCRSLFTVIPQDRTCAQAGISPHWCTCHQSVDVSDHPSAAHLADLVVESINYRLTKDPDIDKYYVCEILKVHKVLYIREKVKPFGTEYIVAIKTKPGGAEFEGTVVRRQNQNTVEHSISRLNNYANESACARNPVSKLYCYCKLIQEEVL